MRAGDCKHFKGIQNVCDADVDPKTVRDDSGKGPYRWPCVTSLRLNKNEPCRTTCAKFAAVTADEEKAFIAREAKALEAIMDNKCPECGAELVVQTGERTRVRSCTTHGFVSRECGIGSRDIEEP